MKGLATDLRIDADQAAEVLIALVDGLCNRWLAGAMERARATELLVATLSPDNFARATEPSSTRPDMFDRPGRPAAPP